MEIELKVPLSKPDLSQVEEKYLSSAFKSSWISSTGEYVDRFEEAWALESQTKYALSVSNGTVALHLILVALGIGEGDEVIVPSLTYIATANAVRYTGATPVFADCSPSDWNISLSEVQRLTSARTKALICVHIYGVPCDLDSLVAHCKTAGIFLIEDAAQAPFSEISKRRIGSYGVASSFSFYGNKIITSGEGGAVVTSDFELYNRMKLLRGQGMDPQRRYFFPVIGFNYRLTNMQCAILLGQVERSGEMLEKRRKIFDSYHIALQSVKSLKFQEPRHGVISTPWLFTCLIDGIDQERRDLVISELRNFGVETRPIFLPVHDMPPYKLLNSESLSHTFRIASSGISLPTFSTLSASEQEYVSQSFLSVLSKLEIE
jgi:perosamine synthetase